MSSRGSSFYFQGRSVHRPEYLVFHRHREQQPTDPIHNYPPLLVGYVHYPTINGARRRQFEPCPGPRGTRNSVGARICVKRLAQTTPRDWMEDPYFMCHLLALAQLQERELSLFQSMTYTVGF